MKKINEPILLQWRLFLAKQNPGKAVSVFFLIIICTWFVNQGTHDVFLTLATFFVLFMAVSSYYVPVTYIVTEEKIYKQSLFFRQSRNWSDFRRYEQQKSSIKLYTMARPSKLDNYRAFLVLCPVIKLKAFLTIADRKIHENRPGPDPSSEKEKRNVEK